MEKKTLGAFIALLRKEKGFTQKQLAELLNVSDKTVSHWECDENSPDISILPFLAQALGVSVDELLRGEKNFIPPVSQQHYTTPDSKSFSDKASGFASKALNRIKYKMTGNISERYRYFRMLSLVGTAIALVVILSITLTNLVAGSVLGYYMADDMLFLPGIILFIGSLWALAASLGFTLGARFAFSKGMHPSHNATEEEKSYIYRANGFCFNNLFLVFCTLPMALTGIQDILDFAVILNIAIAVLCLAALWLILLLVLNKKGILRTEKKKMLTLKYTGIFLSSALAVSLALLLFREAYYPPLEDIIFDNSAEFIAYMETPKNKPEESYLIDGVTASTFPPTMPAPGHTSPSSESPVQTLPSENTEEEIGETVLGYCGNEWVSFRWLNQDVSDFAYLENDGTFRVITYEAKIKQNDMWILVDDGVPILIFAFTVTDALVCLFLYRRRLKSI